MMNAGVANPCSLEFGSDVIEYFGLRALFSH